MNLLQWLVWRAYALPDTRLCGVYDAAVVLDYAGEMRNNEVWLPEAETKSLLVVRNIRRGGRVQKIVWACTDGFGVPVRMLNGVKKIEVYPPNYSPNYNDGLPCTNSITEAEAIIAAHPAMKRVIIIGDWRHIPRVVAIWKKLFKGEIAHLSVDARWTGSNHPSPWCRSDEVFLLMNIAHHAALKIIGIDRLRKLRHPVRR